MTREPFRGGAPGHSVFRHPEDFEQRIVRVEALLQHLAQSRLLHLLVEHPLEGLSVVKLLGIRLNLRRKARWLIDVLKLEVPLHR